MIDVALPGCAASKKSGASCQSALLSSRRVGLAAAGAVGFHGQAKDDVRGLRGLHGGVRLFAGPDAIDEVADVGEGGEIEAARSAALGSGLHVDGGALRVERVGFAADVEAGFAAVELFDLVVETRIARSEERRVGKEC